MGRRPSKERFADAPTLARPTKQQNRRRGASRTGSKANERMIGQGVMLTAAEYRREAEDYVRQAENVTDSKRRVRLLEMAQSCIRLADQVERRSTGFSDIVRT